MHIVSAITGESTIVVSPRMAICSGIILPEAVFNQQPITNIVFHIVTQHQVHYHRRGDVKTQIGSSQTQSKVHSYVHKTAMMDVTCDPILLSDTLT